MRTIFKLNIGNKNGKVLLKSSMGDFNAKYGR